MKWGCEVDTMKQTYSALIEGLVGYCIPPWGSSAPQEKMARLDIEVVNVACRVVMGPPPHMVQVGSTARVSRWAANSQPLPKRNARSGSLYWRGIVETRYRGRCEGWTLEL